MGLWALLVRLIIYAYMYNKYLCLVTFDHGFYICPQMTYHCLLNLGFSVTS